MKLRNIILFAVVALLVSSCDFLDKMPDVHGYGLEKQKRDRSLSV